MPFELPHHLGPFSVDALGRIAPRDGADMPQFLFQWRDRRISARLMGRDGDGCLMLTAWLGRVPSSAGRAPPEGRIASFAALRGLLDALPADWRARLLPDHQVRLEAEVLLSWPATAVDLMTQLTRFLLALAPYLDLLDEGSVLETPGAVGMANT